MDWRRNRKKLLKIILKELHSQGFDIRNEEKALTATKGYSTKNKKYTYRIEFPANYPHDIITGFIKSPGLLDSYFRKPIKHLTISDYQNEYFNVCLRGAWNDLDFTDFQVVESEIKKWIKEYENGEKFKDDFDLPENTLFFPPADDGVSYFIPGYFFNLDIVKENSYGLFEFYMSEDKVCIVTKVTKHGGEGGLICVSERRNLPDKKMICNRLFLDRKFKKFEGIWQYSSIPPSPFVLQNNQLDISRAVYEYLYGKITHPNQHFHYLIFYKLFNKLDAIAIMLEENDGQVDVAKCLRYLKPQVLSDENLFSRAGGLLDNKKVQNSKIAILGLGAIGSQCAISLARLGIKNFIVLDNEKVCIQNVMRHVSDLYDVNHNKVDVVVKKIGRINPEANVEFINKSIFSDVDFNTLDVDIVVSAIADDAIEGFVNQELIKRKKTAIYGRTTTTSYACRLIKVKPGQDACLECLKHYNYFDDLRYVKLRDEDLSIKKDLAKFKGCTAPSYVGVNLDINIYSNLLSRMVFENLNLGNKKYHQPIGANHMIYATRLVEEEPKIEESHHLYSMNFRPLKGCRVCGDQKKPYVAVVIDINTFQTIRELAHKSKKVETGGILIGCEIVISEYGEENKFLLITNCTLPGPNAIRKLAYFDRDVEYCSNILNKYHSKSKGVLNYVGEWHSHPSQSVSPSPLDDSSLFKITKAKGYKMPSPVSIIHSSTTDNYSITVYCGKRKFEDNCIISDLSKIADKLKIKIMKGIVK